MLHPSWPILVASSRHGDILEAPCHARLGCQPGAQTQSRWLQEQGAAAKGYFHSCNLQVCPRPGQTAVFQGHTPPLRGYSKAHPQLKATLCQCLAPKLRNTGAAQGKTTRLFFKHGRNSLFLQTSFSGTVAPSCLKYV